MNNLILSLVIALTAIAQGPPANLPTPAADSGFVTFQVQNLLPDEEVTNKAQQQAEQFLNMAKDHSEYFAELALEQERNATNLDITFTQEDFIYEDQISPPYAYEITKISPGTIYDKIIETFAFNPNNKIIHTELSVIQLLEKRTKERTHYIPKSVKVQHILISYEGANRAEGVTRTKEEAETLAKDILAQAQGHADFTALAKEHSDEPGVSESGGLLDLKVSEDDRTYVEEFSSAALTLTASGQIVAEPVQTQFGYHIIKATEFTPAHEETTMAPQVKYNQISFSTVPNTTSLWKKSGLNSRHIASATTQTDEYNQINIVLTFTPEGSEIFANLTEKIIGQPLAIFINNKIISAPTVNSQITGGQAIITGSFSLEEAKLLAEKINNGILPSTNN